MKRAGRRASLSGTLEKGLAVLAFLGRATEAFAAEAGKTVGLSRSTAHRILGGVSLAPSYLLELIRAASETALLAVVNDREVVYDYYKKGSR